MDMLTTVTTQLQPVMESIEFVHVNKIQKEKTVKDVNLCIIINHGHSLQVKMQMNVRNVTVMAKLMHVYMMKNSVTVDVSIVGIIQVVQCVINVHLIIIAMSPLANAFHVPVIRKDQQLLSVGVKHFCQ